ncbi:MAG: DUF6178 family protein [Gammaproteobacteria bacterium]|nr:DUF6178 family protein [Gammaproteobacteria bacterium]
MPRDPVPTAPNLLSLADNPKLPALVKKLPHPVLAKLIGVVGVEDAAPLVAMTTPQQMRALFDDVLWENPSPGLPARFSVGEFLRWLEVLNEESVAFTAERLQTLGEQFLAAALGQILDVHGKDAQFGGQAVLDDRADFGDFLVRTLPGYDDHWDTVRTTLSALHQDNPRFLDRVLRRCTPSWTGFVSERPYALARVDEGGDRDIRREQAGFVSAETASAFLAEARVAPLATLVESDGYDPISARYRARQTLGTEDTDPATTTDAPIDDDLLDLLATLSQVEGIARAPQLLAPSGTRTRTIKTLLAHLERDRPVEFAARMGELVYLSNVLMAGVSSIKLSEAEAPNVALAICNLAAGQGGPLDDPLTKPAGLIRLFRIGWHTLCRVPPLAARRLVDVLRDPVIRERLGTRAWILSEVDVAIADLVNRVDLDEFDDVEESLGIVSLVVEAEASQWLKALIAELPRVPVPTDDTEHIDTRTRDIQNADDLALVERFLARLPEQVKS